MQVPSATVSPSSHAAPPPDAPGKLGVLSNIVQLAVMYSAASGAMYYVTRLFKSKDSLPPVQSFLLCGAFNGGLQGLAKQTYVFGVHLLGNFEQNESAIQAGQATIGNRLRQRCWKVVHRLDGVVNKVDAFVSERLGIRTAIDLNLHYEKVQVRVQGKMEETIQLVHNDSNVLGLEELSVLEIIRFVFWESVTTVALNASTLYLSNRMVEKIGYEAPGASAEMSATAMLGKTNLYSEFAFNLFINLAQSFMTVYKMNQAAIAQREEEILRTKQKEDLVRFLAQESLDPTLKDTLEQDVELLGIVGLNPTLQVLLDARPALEAFLPKDELDVQILLNRNPTLQDFILANPLVQQGLAQNQRLQNILIGRDS